MSGKNNTAVQENVPPMGTWMIAREFKKDKIAIFSLGLLVVLLLVIFTGAMLADQDKVMYANTFDKYAASGTVSTQGQEFTLGTDEGGRNILGQLIIGAGSSVTIGFAITVLTSVIGVGLGIISGYYGRVIDNILVRIVDFTMVLPIILIIIIFVSIISRYNVWSSIFIMSAFCWVVKARLFRGKTLSEARRNYVSASKTMGTNDFRIMFHEIIPNLGLLVITNLTMNLAANIGIETTLTFLDFGLPVNVSSLGTLIGYASNGEVLVNRQWIRLPASILISVLVLSINYVGQAFKRSADTRQRLS